MAQDNRRIQIAFTTCGDIERAEALARALVSAKVAACVNIIPQVKSIYTWQGRLEAEAEALLMIKTSAARMTRLKTLLAELHDYDLPELIVVDAVDGNPDYLRWVYNSVSD